MFSSWFEGPTFNNHALFNYTDCRMQQFVDVICISPYGWRRSGGCKKYYVPVNHHLKRTRYHDSSTNSTKFALDYVLTLVFYVLLHVWLFKCCDKCTCWKWLSENSWKIIEKLTAGVYQSVHKNGNNWLNCHGSDRCKTIYFSTRLLYLIEHHPLQMINRLATLDFLQITSTSSSINLEESKPAQIQLYNETKMFTDWFMFSRYCQIQWFVGNGY